MIKNIIKRDGSTQPFDPNKVNGWGIWASKHLEGVDWGSIVLNATSKLPETVSSETLQLALIDECHAKRSWMYSRMAGRLYAALQRKRIYEDNIPTILDLHNSMIDAGLLADTFVDAWSDEDYHIIDMMLEHDRDFGYAYYQLQQFNDKYALQDRTGGKVFETPQFVYMRVAMALSLEERKDRLGLVKKFYDAFSKNKINIPTPYFVNSGTTNSGFISCCLYESDDNAASLAAGDHIAYMMTVASAGIGSLIQTRSIGKPVRGGLIPHQGKLAYYRALAGAIGANLQNGRGGAATVTYTVYDPEVETIHKLKNPMTPPAKSIRALDYSMSYNNFFVRKAAKGEKYHTFDYNDCRPLFTALYSKDEEEFERLYNQYVEEGKYESELDAREVLLSALTEAVETGRHYLLNLTEMNRHTPFIDPIRMSNLCAEISLPTEPFDSVVDLYSQNTETGEIAMCAIAGICPDNIDNAADYQECAYLTLKMVDVGIRTTNYPFPQARETARNRMSAGIGIVGLATYLARKGLSYTTQAGKNEIHRLFESHMYYLIKASLRLSKEMGLAPWMHKTAWPNGYLPIDSYNKNVDTITDVPLQHDWEGLRKEIVENGGIRNSVLVAHMPAESSSISSGTTNGVYPMREKFLLKTNGTKSIVYVVPDSETLQYESVWQIPMKDVIECYGIMQKFTDQAISADLWVSIIGENRLSASQLLKDFFLMNKLGVKTRYYINSRTSKQLSENDVGCAGGGCTL